MTTYPETLVARVTGIKKPQIVATRRACNLAKDVDWLTENNAVVYTSEGLTKICRALGIDAAALQWPAEGAAAEPPADDEVEETGASAASGEPAVAQISPAAKISVEGPAAAARAALLARARALPTDVLATAVAIATDFAADPAPEKLPPPAGDPLGAPPALGLPGPEIETHLAAAVVADGVDRLQAGSSTLVEVKVRKRSPNPRVVEGELDGKPVIVGVRENKNFLPGMTLKATHAGGSYYRHFGNCPRWPGRW